MRRPGPWPAEPLIDAFDEALRRRETGKGEVILFNLSGHGHFDRQAYADDMAGPLHDYEYNEQEVAMALAGLPSVG